MTEKSNEAYDFYARQAILAGNRVPVLLGGMGGTLVQLYNTANAEVGTFGTGTLTDLAVTNGTMMAYNAAHFLAF